MRSLTRSMRAIAMALATGVVVAAPSLPVAGAGGDGSTTTTSGGPTTPRRPPRTAPRKAVLRVHPTGG